MTTLLDVLGDVVGDVLGFLVGGTFVFGVDDVFGRVLCDVLRTGVLGFVFGDVVGGVVVFGTVVFADVVGVLVGDVFGFVVGDVFGLVVGKVVCDVVCGEGTATGRKHAALVVILVV